MTRTQNIVRNFKFSILKYFLQIVLKFVLRTAIIYVLGKSYLGLNGLFSNILSILNLAELGIGSAIVFSMYKPVANNDIEKIKTLNNLYKKIYYVIALIVLLAGLAISPFLKYLIADGSPSDINIYIVYFVFLFNTVVSYLAGNKSSLLFVYQREDISSKIATVFLFLLTTVQIALLFIFKNYYAYLCVMPIFTLLETFTIIKVANKLYPKINGKALPLDKTTKKEIIKNISAMSMHKVGDVLVNSTDNLLISSLIGLTAVGIFSNYTLITTSISSLILVAVNSLRSSTGNLVATCDVEYVYRRYKVLNFMFAWIAGFCTICLICLSQNFILLWTKDQSYLFSNSFMIVMMVNFYLTSMRYISSMFKNVAGLMIQDVWKPIIQGITNLVTSIILAKFLGILGIVIGTVISSLIAPVWVEPYVLHKKYFKKSTFKFFISYFYYAIITFIGCLLTYFLCGLLGTSSKAFIVKMIICVLVPNAVFLGAYFWLPEFKELFNLALTFIKNFLRKKKKNIKEDNKNNTQENTISEKESDLENVVKVDESATKNIEAENKDINKDKIN